MLHSCISAGFLVDCGLDDNSRNVSIEQKLRAVLVVAVTVARQTRSIRRLHLCQFHKTIGKNLCHIATVHRSYNVVKQPSIAVLGYIDVVLQIRYCIKLYVVEKLLKFFSFFTPHIPAGRKNCTVLYGLLFLIL